MCNQSLHRGSIPGIPSIHGRKTPTAPKRFDIRKLEREDARGELDSKLSKEIPKLRYIQHAEEK